MENSVQMHRISFHQNKFGFANCWFRPRWMCNLCCHLKIKCAMIENKEAKKTEKKKEKKSDKGKRER